MPTQKSVDYWDKYLENVDDDDVIAVDDVMSRLSGKAPASMQDVYIDCAETQLSKPCTETTPEKSVQNREAPPSNEDEARPRNEAYSKCEISTTVAVDSASPRGDEK